MIAKINLKYASCQEPITPVLAHVYFTTDTINLSVLVG